MNFAIPRVLPLLRLSVLGCIVAGSLSLAAVAAPGDATRGAQRAPVPDQHDAQHPAGEERRRAWSDLPPEQRNEVWRSMSPEQRELLMRRVPRDERRQMWNQMTPEQRQQMRQRFIEQREQRNAEGRPRLSPEERQRLREQIRESQRDWKKKPPEKDPPR